MDWFGHDFAFRVRVDVEHVEAQRYLGDFRLCKVAVINLLDMLDEMNARLTFCVLGITAEMYPELLKEMVARGHEVYGHSMYHEPALAGRPYREQRHEMRRMRDAIQTACGVQVQAIGVPHHGMADENTLRAAADTGIVYVEGNKWISDSPLLQWRKIEGTEQQVLVPGAGAKIVSDYTDRRPYWALIHEEAFSPEDARTKWKAQVDWAKQTGGYFWMVVHPWMLMANAGEVQVVKDVIRYAQEQGAWMATIQGLIELAGPKPA